VWQGDKDCAYDEVREIRDIASVEKVLTLQGGFKSYEQTIYQETMEMEL
jgi:hypothetical protein